MVYPKRCTPPLANPQIWVGPIIFACVCCYRTANYTEITNAFDAICKLPNVLESGEKENRKNRDNGQNHE